MITWPPDLIEDVARRRAVLFLGAGVSKNSVGQNGERPPTWIEFLNEGVSRCPQPVAHVKKLLKESDLLTACEIVKVKLGAQWNRLLNDQFVRPAYRHAIIHEHLFRLDLRLVLTQNFDKLYDTYAQTASNNTVAVKNYYDADVSLVLRGDSRAVVKVHGTIDQPARMIFTREEYARARNDNASFYSALDALALTHTFVFVGCGITDPDVQMMLERHARTHPYGRPHYIVMPRGLHVEVISSIRRNYNLEVLAYDPANNHSELSDSLASLVNEVEAARVGIAARQDW